MENRNILEIAFAYASSGQARNVDDVRRYLEGLGYHALELRQFSGLSLRRQLLQLINKASAPD